MSWLTKYKDIYQGWKNDLFPNKDILEIAEKRASICAGCPLNVANTCSSKKFGMVKEDFIYKVRGNEVREKDSMQYGCGCPLSKKTKSPDSQCPLNNW